MKTIKIKRKISSTLLRIKELEKFKGKSVEIKLDINELNTSNKKEEDDLAGIFLQYADISLLQNEKNAWTLAAEKNMELNYVSGHKK